MMVLGLLGAPELAVRSERRKPRSVKLDLMSFASLGWAIFGEAAGSPAGGEEPNPSNLSSLSKY